MTNSNRTYAAILTLACAALAPARAFAQAHPKVATAAQIDGLTAQEKEMLSLATDLSKRCTAAMERWIASKETTEEKLFAGLYFPMGNTDPPKFTTDWDKLSDRDILPIEDAALSKSSTIVFAIIMDKNGYLPTHNQRFSQPLTGNKAVDLVNNRTKMIVVHRTALAAARNEAPFLFQRYPRDTGEMMAEITVPIFVRGAHWGAVRIGYRPVDAS